MKGIVPILVAIMAARMRAMILIPLLIISFSFPLKDREQDSLVAPDQSHLSTVGLYAAGRVALTGRDV